MAEVNLDVAMESTSQEILEKINSAYPSGDVFYGTVTTFSITANATKEVVNITGKGKLVAASFTNRVASTSAAKLTIEIDGVATVFSVKSTSSGSSAAKAFILGKPEGMVSSDTFGLQYAGLPATYNNTPHSVVPFETTTITGDTYYALGACLLNNYIPFNESLVVSVYFLKDSSYTTHSAGVIYTLDED